MPASSPIAASPESAASTASPGIVGSGLIPQAQGLPLAPAGHRDGAGAGNTGSVRHPGRRAREIVSMLRGEGADPGQAPAADAVRS